MNLNGKLPVSIVTVVGIFIIGFVLGAALLTGIVHFSEEAEIPDKIGAPNWITGQYWTYSFKTPDIEDVTSRIIVASDEGEDYLVGVAYRFDAQRHGVLNYNPMLGRISIKDLSIYEQGMPQQLFSFPLKEGKQWSFSMFGYLNFNARVTSIIQADTFDGEKTIITNIRAESSTGESLVYSYDSTAKWVHSLILADGAGNPELEMNLVSYGKGFAGQVYFVRGRDILDRTYSAPAFDTYKTIIQGHPEWGPFDSLIYHFEITTGDNSRGYLFIRDPAAPLEGKEQSFGSNTYESALGTISSISDDLSVTVELIGNANLHLRIAGGIEYVWTV